MATPDVTFIAGLDDSQLQSKLQSAGRNTAKLVGGIMPQMQGAAGLLGLVPGAGPMAFLGVATGAMMQLFRWQSRVADDARREREEREKSRDAAMETYSTNMGRARVDAYGGDSVLKRLEIAQRMQGLRDDAEKTRYARADAAKDVNERWDIAAEYRMELIAITNLEGDLLAQLDREVEATSRALVLRTRMEGLMSQGAQAEADTLGEMVKHEQEMAKVAKMAVDSPTLGRQYRAEENARHAARMDQIRKEELDRQAAEERTAERQAEQIENERRSADLLEMQLQAKVAMAAGDAAIADQLQRQVEHAQRLEQIRNMSNITEEQRLRLMQLSEEIMNAPEADRARREGGRATSATLGLADYGRLSARELGGGDRVQRDMLMEARKSNRKLDQIAANTRADRAAVFS